MIALQVGRCSWSATSSNLLRSFMMFPVLSTFLLGSGVWLALLCALVGLGFAYYLVDR